MSNPVAWRGKGRTPTPNSRQKRAGLYLDASPICHGCWARVPEHAHHMLPKDFNCRTSWHTMRPYCEPCHVQWHRAATVVFNTEAGIWRTKLDSHQRLLCPVVLQSESRRRESMSMRSVSGYIVTRQHIRTVFTPRWGV